MRRIKGLRHEVGGFRSRQQDGLPIELEQLLKAALEYALTAYRRLLLLSQLIPRQ